MKPKIIIGVGLAGYTRAAAGNSWVFLQYALGFRDLGWDVWLVESLPADRGTDASEKPCPHHESEAFRYLEKFLSEFDLQNQASLWIGADCPNEKAFQSFARDASIFLNLSGHFKRHDLIGHIPRRLYVDLDPAFTQIWATVYNCDMNFAGHSHFLTVGARFGKPGVLLPETGHSWIPFLPAVYLPAWTQPAPAPDGRAFWTTVTHWHGYPAVEWNGRSYGNKNPNFLALRDLPRQSPARLGLASDMTPEYDEYASFAEAGWKLFPAAEITNDWHDYHRFIAESRGEFSVAKQGYVVSNCGWFSDRSICYLALGRPVILQETGWSDVVPPGPGILPFTDLPSAAAALEKVEADYSNHSRGARQTAEKYFSTRVVLPRILKAVGL